MNQQHQNALMQLATERVQFKKQLLSYVIVNIFLWFLWLGGYMGNNRIFDFRIPTPAIIMFFWGFGLTFRFLKLYVIDTASMIEKEYEQLKNK